MKELNVFMVMPFQEQFLKLFEMIKEKLGEKYEFSHAGDLDNQQNILQDIVVGISNADVVIVDLTGLNPNVFYELGLCHALNKKVILITQEISELPFDIKSYRVNDYTTDFWKINEIISKIEKYLIGAKDGSIQFGNPVRDYYPIKTATQNNDIVENIGEIDNLEKDEKGFLDFIAEINDDTSNLTEEVNLMSSELNELTGELKVGAEEIERISKTPSSGNANYIRGIARKIGENMQEFSDKMDKHNTRIENTWENIENNFLDLIDNKYMESSDNKKGLIKSIKGLFEMQEIIKTSNGQLQTLIYSFMSVKGAERKLTQAANSLEERMRKYFSIMNGAISSIDRIITKAELLLGKINFEIDTED